MRKAASHTIFFVWSYNFYFSLKWHKICHKNERYLSIRDPIILKQCQSYEVDVEADVEAEDVDDSDDVGDSAVKFVKINGSNVELASVVDSCTNGIASYMIFNEATGANVVYVLQPL